MGTHFNKIYEIVSQTISDHHMFQSGDRVLIGVSGGPDSVALLHLLMAVGPQYDLDLAIAHLNHGLRETAADGDANFVAALSKRLRVPLYSEKRDVLEYRRRHRLSLETASRHVRYAFFNELLQAKGFDKIALGHHMDDNAELVLMNLLRGSGPTGLAGIPPVRDNHIVRPLMGLTRKQIKAYLAGKNLSYVIDASNNDQRHLRNRIRHELLPLLATHYNGRIAHHLNQTAAVCRTEDQWLERAVDPIFNAQVIEQADSRIVLSIAGMADLDLAMQRRLLRRALKLVAKTLRQISFGHIEAVRGLLTRGRPWQSIDLPHQIRVSRMDPGLVFSREKETLRHIPPAGKAEGPVFSYQHTPPGVVALREIGLRLVFTVHESDQLAPVFQPADPNVYMDLEELSLPVLVRNRKAGDRFAPMGLGGTQSVRKYLSSREKNLTKRSRCPVMISDDQIVWVIGHGIADAVKVRSKTRQVLKVQVLLA